MKKILLFTLLGLFAVSCSNDDPTVIEQEIIGTWEAAGPANFVYPPDMPTYIRFEANTYYSSNTQTTPTENGSSYTISFNSESKQWILNISGDSREYVIVLINDDLDLRYLLTAADGDEAEWQSQPYKRSAAQASQTDPE